MRRIFAGGVVWLAAVGAAVAADVGAPVQQMQVPLQAPPPFSWTGIYAGFNAGFGLANASVTASSFGLSASSSENLTGAIAGGQLGFNYQNGPLLLGLEVDAQWSGQSFSTDFFGATATDRISWFGTARPRVGLAVGRALFYATGGAGFGTWRTDVSAPGFSGFAQTTRLVGVAGAGIEVAAFNNVSVKAEYLFLDTGNITQSVGFASATANVTDNIFRVGVNVLMPVGR